MLEHHQTGGFSVLCTAKFRNLTTRDPRGSQIFWFDRSGVAGRVTARSTEWAPELDTQGFVAAGSWVAVLHHQAHKAHSTRRTGVEVYATEDLFALDRESDLLTRRLPLPREGELIFPSSLAYDTSSDLLAVGINGQEFKSAIYVYHGTAKGQPRLVNRIDLAEQGHLRPSGLAFMDRQLWAASYSGGFVSLIVDPVNSGTIHRREGAMSAPIGLHGRGGCLFVTDHLRHELTMLPERKRLSVPPIMLSHPWGLTGRSLDGQGIELLMSNLNLDDEARSWVASCVLAPCGSTRWTRLRLEGDSDLSGFSAIQFH